MRTKIFIVYKEYRNWEDNDSNGAEIIAVFKKRDNAIKSLHKSYNNELQFFIQNDMNINKNNCSDVGFYVETINGDVEGYIKDCEVL